LPSERVAVASLDGIRTVPSSSAFEIKPVRLHFGIGSFGVNAYTARDAGEEVIEEHDELGSGAGRHEELYIVARGHAAFRLGKKEIDAPAGTLVFVGDPAVRRAAVAKEDGTTVLVVGGVVGQAFQASPWEAWLAAYPHLEAGEPEKGVKIFLEALERHPGNPNVLYNLACFESLAGQAEDALSHLAEAVEADPRMREWAQTDSDFDAIRGDPRFPVGA
jgi:tetratricopeptide (TPR) repeat protein